MFTLVVFVLVFFILSWEIGWEECLQNDLFCVEWDIKPQLSLSVLWLCWFDSAAGNTKGIQPVRNQFHKSQSFPLRSPSSPWLILKTKPEDISLVTNCICLARYIYCCCYKKSSGFMLGGQMIVKIWSFGLSMENAHVCSVGDRKQSGDCVEDC